MAAVAIAVITMLANRNRNTNPYKFIEGNPGARGDRDRADDRVHHHGTATT